MNQFLPLVLFLTPTLASAHPFHVSIAEAEWKAKTKTLEVALRVHPEDLEKALRLKTKKLVDLDKTANVDEFIQAYLNDTIVVKDAEGKKQKLNWVGKEMTVKAAWLYFEVPLKGGLDGTSFEQRVFFELLDDQVNTINFRDRAAKKQATLTFTKEKPSRKFEWGKK